MMGKLQVKQNNIMRILLQKRKGDHVSIPQLLQQTGMTSVNRMTVESILMEMWRMSCSELAGGMKTKNNSTIETRSRTRGDLDTGRPAPTFRFFGTKLWNSSWSGEIRKAKSKYTARREVKSSAGRYPMWYSQWSFDIIWHSSFLFFLHRFFDFIVWLIPCQFIQVHVT